MTTLYAGLDIGLERTAACVVDDQGCRIAEAVLPTEPEPLIAWLRQHAPGCARVGLEACPLSDWLHDHMAAAGLPVICLETHDPAPDEWKRLCCHALHGGR